MTEINIQELRTQKAVYEKQIEAIISKFEQELPDEVIVENVVATKLIDNTKLNCKINLKINV